MTLDTKALRDLASKAYGGHWTIERHTKIDKRFSIYDSPNHGHEVCRFDYDDVDHRTVDATAKYIAAMSPDVCVALLDQLAEMTKARDEACAGWSDVIDEFHDNDPEAELGPDRDRIAALRTIGSPK